MKKNLDDIRVYLDASETLLRFANGDFGTSIL